MKNFLMSQGAIGVAAMFVICPFIPSIMPWVVASVVGGVIGCIWDAA